MFKHPLEPLRTSVLPSTSLPPWFMNMCYWNLLQWYNVQQQLTSLIPVLARFRCSVCLTVFLHPCIALFVLLPFVLCVPFPFNAPFVFCPIQLLHSTSFFIDPSLTTTITSISSLFPILILPMHLVHPLYAMVLHSLHVKCSTSSSWQLFNFSIF